MKWRYIEARIALIERVGVAEYNRHLMAHLEAGIAASVNGYPIRKVPAIGGSVYAVEGTGRALPTLAAATTFAETRRPKP
jgi:hypothetical protein